jgi:antitoxin component YwqK of YwqJK toxin-antitoxin module
MLCDNSSSKKASDDNIVKEFYSNGVIKTEISVKDSLREGPTRNYDTQGRLVSR